MKRIVIIFVIIGLVFYFFTISYATETANVFLSTKQDAIEKGEEIEIILNIEKVKTAAFTSYLYFDNEKLELIEGPENTNVIGNRIIYVWYDTKGGEGAKEGEIVKFILKAKEEGIATFTIQGEFYNQRGELISTECKEKQIQIGRDVTNLQRQVEEQQGTNVQKDNTNLQVLRLNREGLTPTFDKETKEYYITIPNEVQNLEVLALSENPNSSIEITGNTDLKEGLQIITIYVDAEDKTKKSTYTIQVTKTKDIELANTNLEMLAIENVFLNPPFDMDVINYKAEVSNEAEKVNLLAIPEQEQAMAKITGNEALQEGNNQITVEVTAPNGFTKKKYQINVYKRNREEEQKYQAEQKLKNEMLEQAYEISELNTKTQENKEESKKNFATIGIAVVVMVAIGIIFGVYKIRSHKKH